MDLRELGDRLAGDVVMPGDETWDTARQAWNLAVDQRPVAVVYPESADDVVATVRLAAERGLRIAFNAGGHNAGPIDWSGDTLLLKTERMRGIEIDAAARRARVEAGVLSKPLAVAAGEHGLAYLAGTSPDVGVLGYALGGGLSWMVRKFGLACNSIVAAEVVTADGRHVRTDRDTEPELFWALRGGGGNVAAVTALELELFPIAEIYAGALFWPIERAAEILNAWREWIETVPDECESLGRMLQLPDVPFLPDHLRGRSFVLVEAAFIGDASDGAALVQPLRDLGPEIDTIAMMPTSELSVVNMDPDFPLPYTGEGILLTDLPPAGDRRDGRGVRRITAPARRGSPPRRRRRHPIAGSRRARRDRSTVRRLHLRARAGCRTRTRQSIATSELVLGALGPWDSGRRYLNFAESRVDPRSIFPVESYDRLKRAKARYDPTGLFLANHGRRARWRLDGGQHSEAEDVQLASRPNVSSTNSSRSLLCLIIWVRM